MNFTDVSWNELGASNNGNIYRDSAVYTAYVSNTFKNANNPYKLLYGGRTSTYIPQTWTRLNWPSSFSSHSYLSDLTNTSYVMVGKEIMHTNTISSNMLGVTRGQFGTTAMDISINTPIFVLNVDEEGYPSEERTIQVNSNLATQSQLSNTWNHIVLSYDDANNTIDTYLNGNKESFTGQTVSSSNRLKIANGFMGKIAYLNVWDTSLSDSDVSELYQSRDVPNDSKYKYDISQNTVDIIRNNMGAAKYLLNVNYNVHDVPFYNHGQQFNRVHKNVYLGPQIRDSRTYNNLTTLDASFIRVGDAYDENAVYVIDYTRELDGLYHLTSPTTERSITDTRHLSVYGQNYNYSYTAQHGGLSHNPTRSVLYGPLLRLNNYIYLDLNLETNEFDFFMDASGTRQFHPRKIFKDQAYTFMSVASPSSNFTFYITDISAAGEPSLHPPTFESQLGVLHNDSERDVSLGTTNPLGSTYYSTGISGDQSVTFRCLNDVSSTDTLYIYDPSNNDMTSILIEDVSASFSDGQQTYIVMGSDVCYNQVQQGVIALNWDEVVIDQSIEITGEPTEILYDASSYEVTYEITDNSANTNADPLQVSNFTESATRFVNVNTYATPNISLLGQPEMTVLLHELSAIHNFSFDGGVLGQIVSDDGPVENISISYEFYKVLATSTQQLNSVYDISSQGEYLIKYIARDEHASDPSFGYNAEFPSATALRKILVINDPNQSHSVQFNSESGTENPNFDFDILAFGDLSNVVANVPELSTVLYQEGFDFTDSSASAVLDVPLSYLNATNTKPAMFKFNMPMSESTTEYEQAKGMLRYQTDSRGWTDLSFSTATVTQGNVNTFNHEQTISKDFPRSLFNQIIGANRLNSLFKNQRSLHEHIVELDSSFNEQIREILSNIGNAGFLTDNDYGAYKDGSQNFHFSPSRFDATGTSISGFDSYSYDESLNSDASRNYHALKQSRFSAFNPFRILARTILSESDVDHEDFVAGTSQGWNNPSTPGYSPEQTMIKYLRLYNDGSGVLENGSSNDDMTIAEVEVYVDGVNICRDPAHGYDSLDMSTRKGSANDTQASNAVNGLNTKAAVTAEVPGYWTIEFTNTYSLSDIESVVIKVWVESTNNTTYYDRTRGIQIEFLNSSQGIINNTVRIPNDNYGDYTYASFTLIDSLNSTLTNPDDLGNEDRRVSFINDLNYQVDSFWNDPINTVKEYSAFGSDGNFYSVWLSNTFEATTAGANLVDGILFSEFLKGVNVYAAVNNNPTGSSLVAGSATDVSCVSLIENVVDMSYNFNFVEGDRLHLLLKYSAPVNGMIETNYLNTTKKQRTYEVTLNLVNDVVSTTTITVTVVNDNGTNYFYFDGVIAQDLTLTPGQTYIFNQSDSTNIGHRLALYDTTKTSIYTHDNITYTGAAGTDGELEVIYGTSITTPLRFYCQAHGLGMGNNAELNII